MLSDGTNVECDVNDDDDVVDDDDDELKRKSVIEPTLFERHETALAD